MLLVPGCSEYGLGDDADPVDYDPGVPAEGEAQLTCMTSYDGVMPWRKSELWYGDEPPVDASGALWSDDDFDDSAWEVLAGLPDRGGDTTNHDVFYRSNFWLDAVEGATTINFKGNDGMWLVVNEVLVGHWGGEWREDGCVNVESGCGVNYDEPPADVTDLFRVGHNHIAVMLTNGPPGYSLDINAHCIR